MGATRCKLCKRNYPNKIEFRRHLVTLKHRRVTSFQCHLCHKIAGSKGGLTKHLIDIHKIKVPQVYHCDICPKTFRWDSQLVRHSLTHSGENEGRLPRPTKTTEKRYPCQACGQRFRLRTTLEKHQQRRSACSSSSNLSGTRRTSAASRNSLPVIVNKISPTVTAEHVGNIVSPPYSCDDCNRRFKKRGILNFHRRMTHPVNEIRDENPPTQDDLPVRINKTNPPSSNRDLDATNADGHQSESPQISPIRDSEASITNKVMEPSHEKEPTPLPVFRRANLKQPSSTRDPNGRKADQKAAVPISKSVLIENPVPENNELSFPCESCDKSFKLPCMLNFHTRNVHQVSQLFDESEPSQASSSIVQPPNLFSKHKSSTANPTARKAVQDGTIGRARTARQVLNMVKKQILADRKVTTDNPEVAQLKTETRNAVKETTITNSIADLIQKRIKEERTAMKAKIKITSKLETEMRGQNMIVEKLEELLLLHSRTSSGVGETELVHFDAYIKQRVDVEKKEVIDKEKKVETLQLEVRSHQSKIEAWCLLLE